jgi:hypothetical protein
MNKRLVTVFILTLFSVSILSCYSTKLIRVEQLTTANSKKGKVLEVMKKSREWIEFSKDTPGRIIGDNVVCKIWLESDGKTKKLRTVSIPLSEIIYLFIRKLDAGKTLLTLIAVPYYFPISFILAAILAPKY